MTFCHPRTGRCWANQAMAIQMDGPLESPGPGLVQTGLFAGNTTGQVEQLQVGSQFWMNSGYTGPEPPLEVKAVFSTADYARDWIAAYAGNLVTNQGPQNVSQGVRNIAANYPAPSAQTQVIWQAAPQLSPLNLQQQPGGAAAQQGGDAYYQALIADINRALQNLSQQNPQAAGTQEAQGSSSGMPSWLLLGGLVLGGVLLVSLLSPGRGAPAYG